MAEELIISTTASKAEKYQALLPQVEALIAYENDTVANLSNVAAALNSTFDFLWVGFYLKKENQLVLGPFQGPIACTRIPFTKGVCGAAYTPKATMIVEDVNAFPGHIACSSDSQSEIVVPVFKGEEVVAVLDIDSSELASFDEADQNYLEELAKILSEKL